MGLTDNWVAWQFNETVYTLGAFVEARLEEQDKKGRRVWDVDAVLAGRAKRPPRQQKNGRMTEAQLRAVFGGAMGPVR